MAKKRAATAAPSRNKKQKSKASYLVPSKVDQPTAQAARPSIPSAPFNGPSGAPRPVVSSIAMARSRQAARQAQRPGLVTDYRYVLSDLRRIAIIAGVIIVILIALTFVI